MGSLLAQSLEKSVDLGDGPHGAAFYCLSCHGSLVVMFDGLVLRLDAFQRDRPERVALGELIDPHQGERPANGDQKCQPHDSGPQSGDVLRPAHDHHVAYMGPVDRKSAGAVALPLRPALGAMGLDMPEPDARVAPGSGGA